MLIAILITLMIVYTAAQAAYFAMWMIEDKNNH